MLAGEAVCHPLKTFEHFRELSKAIVAVSSNDTRNRCRTDVEETRHINSGLATTSGERDAVLRRAEPADRQVRTLRMTLAYAGCRLSQALALIGSPSDFQT